MALKIKKVTQRDMDFCFHLRVCFHRYPEYVNNTIIMYADLQTRAKVGKARYTTIQIIHVHVLRGHNRMLFAKSQ